MVDKVSISVIIPVYNVDFFYINRCIESIIETDYDNLEILIVDDGSKQNYSAEYENLLAIDKRIILLHKRNGGVSSARNYGISCATCEYICFVDGDDTVSRGCFNEANDIIQKYNSDLVLGSIEYSPNVYDIAEQGPDTITLYKGKEILTLKRSLLNVKNVGFKYQILGSPCARIIKRNYFCNINFDENISICEDQIYIYELLTKASTVVVSPSIWYTYYQNDNSALHSITSPMRYYPYFKKLFTLAQNEKNPEIQNKMFDMIVGFYSGVIRSQIKDSKSMLFNKDELDERFLKESVKQLRIWDNNISISHKLRAIVFKCNAVFLLKVYHKYFRKDG